MLDQMSDETIMTGLFYISGLVAWWIAVVLLVNLIAFTLKHFWEAKRSIRRKGAVLTVGGVSLFPALWLAFSFGWVAALFYFMPLYASWMHTHDESEILGDMYENPQQREP